MTKSTLYFQGIFNGSFIYEVQQEGGGGVTKFLATFRMIFRPKLDGCGWKEGRGQDRNFQLFCRFDKWITTKKKKATRLLENIRLIYDFLKKMILTFFVGINFRKTDEISRSLIKSLPDVIRKIKADLPSVVIQNQLLQQSFTVKMGILLGTTTPPHPFFPKSNKII